MSRPETALKLKGRSTPDIVTISGLVQDALIAPNDMTVEADNRRFVAVINRFMWERVDDEHEPSAPTISDEPPQDARFEDAGDGRLWRVQSALVIERTNRVKRKDMGGTAAPGAIGGKASHYLLSIVPDDGGVTLFFAGGGMIRCEGPALEVFLQDLSEPWPTPQMPVHQDTDDSEIAL